MRWAATYARSLLLPTEGGLPVFLAWAMASGKVPEDSGNPAVLGLDSLYGKEIFAYFSIPSEIAYLLSHLMSVLQRLEPAWTRAFLRRTRFLDPDFQGDVLAVISKGLTKSLLRTLLIYSILSRYDINCTSHRCSVASNHTMPIARSLYTLSPWTECNAP